MANSPSGDIEIILDNQSNSSAASTASSRGSIKEVTSGSSVAGLRVRLSRKQRTVEISTSLSAPSKSGSTTGEWNKKVLFWNQDDDEEAMGGCGLSEKDWNSLGSKEKEGILALGEFLLVVQVVESGMHLPRAHSASADTPFSEHTSPSNNAPSSHPANQRYPSAEPAIPIVERPFSAERKKTLRFSPSIQELSTAAARGASSFLSTSKHLSEMNIAPRPKLSKPSPRFAIPDDTTRKPSSTVFDPIPDTPEQDQDQDHDQTPNTKGYRRRSRSFGSSSTYPKKQRSAVFGFVNDEIEWPSMKKPPGPLQTRFILDVGWCVRYAPSGSVSAMEGGGRYRIMFLDGVALEVDVDKERIEFVAQDGQASA